ncbi:MAG: 3-dehydroquinate synthase [Lentihominibacter sp.]|jgi:3-dehydroquinate synthase
MNTITINTSKPYQMLLGRNLLANSGEFLANTLGSPRLCIVTDTNVNELYGGEDQPFMTSLTEKGFDVCKYVFSSGEKNKTLSTVEKLLDFLAMNHFTREDVLVAFGGGVTGDITGFTASLYMRGIRFVQVPTTLLAAADSSIGGKTGVNLSAGKNLAGAFHSPELVIFDHETLTTLSHENLLDGMAEIIKAGIINDASIIMDLRDYFRKGNSGAALFGNPDLLMSLLIRAIEVKRRIVEADELEADGRRLLNLGHTIGHAIEKCSNYKISHGQAVAIGIACMTDNRIITDILTAFGYSLSSGIPAGQLADSIKNDKKSKGRNVVFVVPEAIGQCRLKSVPFDLLEELLKGNREMLI